MIIGIDGSRAFSSEKTGTENYSYSLLRTLAEIDKTNVYVIYTRKIKNPLQGKQKSIISCHSELVSESQNVVSDPDIHRDDNDIVWPDNFKFVEIPMTRLWTQVGLAYRTWIDKLDLLFVPAHTLPVFRRPGLKTLVTIHDLGYEFLPQYHQFPHKIYLNWSTEYAVKTATKIIAVSKATKNDLVKKLNCDEKKIEVIYEGVDSKRFGQKFTEEEVNNVMKKYGVKKPYILSVGTVQPRKNYKRLIEAFNSFNLKLKVQSLNPQLKTQNFENIQLIIIGKKGWMVEDIYEMPRKLGIEEKVKFLGHVEDCLLPVFYQNAEVFVMPSLFEGFGLPVLEAMASGVPVVTSSASSLPEVAGEAGILVNPYDIDSIVEGITEALKFSIFNFQFSINDQFSNYKIIKTNENFSMIKERGLERARGFSWEKAARETLRIFEKLY